MISKLGAGIFLAVATLFVATPTTVFAASSSATKAKIKKIRKQLNKLPNGAAPVSKVNSLVKKLAKLDPKKTAKYYKTGLKKLAPTPVNKAQANKLAVQLANILKKSGLSSSQIKKITKNVAREGNKFIPQPTPPPYQAMVLPMKFAGALS